MKTNMVKDTHEKAKGINSFPLSKSKKKSWLHSTKRANIFLFIMEVMSEETTTLEPVIDQMPLIREMLNKRKPPPQKKARSGGIKCFLFVS
jgi:hypothetical protein